jgi:hypothetical protein
MRILIKEYSTCIRPYRLHLINTHRHYLEKSLVRGYLEVGWGGQNLTPHAGCSHQRGLMLASLTPGHALERQHPSSAKSRYKGGFNHQFHLTCAENSIRSSALYSRQLLSTATVIAELIALEDQLRFHTTRPARHCWHSVGLLSQPSLESPAGYMNSIFKS